MNYEDFIKEVAEEAQQGQGPVRDVLYAAVAVIKKRTAEKIEVKIPRFGTFYLKVNKPRKMFGGKVTSKGGSIIKFRETQFSKDERSPK